MTDDLGLSTWPTSDPDRAVFDFGGKPCQHSRRTNLFFSSVEWRLDEAVTEDFGLSVSSLSDPRSQVLNFGGKVCQHRCPLDCSHLPRMLCVTVT